MIVTLHIDPSWLAHGAALARILDQIRAVEAPAPWAPRPAREPGDDGDLGELLDGMDGAEASPAALKPMPAPVAAPIPPGRVNGNVPATGRALYKWACDRKCLPEVNRVGKDRGFPRMVSDWSPSDVATAFEELVGSNGKPH